MKLLRDAQPLGLVCREYSAGALELLLLQPREHFVEGCRQLSRLRDRLCVGDPLSRVCQIDPPSKRRELLQRRDEPVHDDHVDERDERERGNQHERLVHRKRRELPRRENEHRKKACCDQEHGVGCHDALKQRPVASSG